MLLFLLNGGAASVIKVYGQSSTDHFGKNRLQHKRFDWTYYKTDNFEIYFYKEGSEIARFVALHAEEEYKRISKVIGYAPFGKTKLLLYNSHSDLLQSNIGLDDEVAFVGGQTNFVKLNAELAFHGNLIDYKNDISTSIARIYITDLIFGGSIREVYQNALLVNLPEWFISGAAAYVGRGWSQEMDDFMRDAVFKYSLRNPAKFRGRDAEWIGQSIFNFMVAKYGEPQVANIISLSRIMRNDREAIEATLNVSYRQFMREWRQYYRDMATRALESYEMPDKKTRVKKHNHRKMDYNKVKISPNGTFVAYTQNKKGRYSVKVTKIKEGKTVEKDPATRKVQEEELKLSDIDRELGITADSTPVATKKEETIPETKILPDFGRKRTMMRGGIRLVNQKVNYNVPLIAWKNNNHLAVLIKKKNRHILRTYNALGIRKSRFKIYNFNQILDFSYSADDNFLVISAERNGQSDIFQYDTRRAMTKIITNDMYDDLHPIYEKGTKNIIWSSNRHNDTLGIDAGRFRLLGSNLNLFKYEPEISTSILTRLTFGTGDEFKPISYDKQTIVYLGDETGIVNAHKIDMTDTNFTSTQLSKNALSFRDYDVNPKNKSMVFVSVTVGKERINYEPLHIDSAFVTPKTDRREQIELLENLEEQRVLKNREEAVKVVGDKLKLENEAEKLETLVDAIMNGSMTDSAIAKLAKDSSVSVLDLDSLQSQIFVFESEKNTLKATEGAEYRSQLAGIKTDQYYLYKSDFQVFASKGGLWKARHRLGVENTVTSIAFDPLRGFGVVMNATLADIFNDHRFYGGLFGSSDLRTSNIFLEYQYLKRRVDLRFRYEKQRLYVSDRLNLPQKYTVNRWELEASLPLSAAFRVSLTPFFMNSRSVVVGPVPYTNPALELLTNYLGYRAETIYDNTQILGHNMQEGTKFRLMYEYNYAFGKVDDKLQKQPTLNFGRVFADIRNYQRIHQELILATRFSGGAFLGPAKKNFLLGGMENWMGANTANTDNEQSPMYIDPFLQRRDWLFNKYVTSLRGFSYNQQYGSNYLLFNAEIRWPIIQYFYRGVIGSNFLRNLQLTGFYDIGSAWTGTTPWDKDNSFNSTFVDDSKSGYTAYVTNYRNPWLQGLGTGLRTMFLGYYLKVDLAWGIYDYVVLKPRWYVTLGYDF